MAFEKTTKESKPEEVAAYLRDLDHPMHGVVCAARKVVLSASASIGEEIKWNSPTFFFAGKMKPTDPKLYVRLLVNFNVFRKDCLRLVFWQAAEVPDPTSFLEGDYKDGRRIALLSSLEDVKRRAPALKAILKAQLTRMPKSSGRRVPG